MINHNKLLCKNFSESVVNIVDSVENKKTYGYETFYTIMQKEIWNHEIADIFNDDVNTGSLEESEYEKFAYSVLKVIENVDDQVKDYKEHKEDCKNAFNIIKQLIEEYDISPKVKIEPSSSKTK